MARLGMLTSGVRANGRQVRTHDAILSGRGLLGRTLEALEASGDGDFREAGRSKYVDHLCFQQSAGDSTGPQVDIAEAVLRQDFADDDVANLRPAAGLEHARDLGDRALLLG